MKHHKRFAVSIALALSCCLTNAAAHAEAEVASEKAVIVNIDAQPLERALSVFAQQAGLQLLMRADAVSASLTAPRLVGTYTAQDALDRLLANTELSYKFIDAHTVAIRAPKVLSGADIVLEADTNGRMQLAQAEQSSLSSAEGRDKERTVEDGKKSSTDSSVKGIPEVMVTGKRNPSLNADIQRSRDDVRPYVVIDRDSIANSGATSVEDLLRKKLSMSYVYLQNNLMPSESSLDGSSSKFALRGLTSGETLILIDGRRTTRRLTSAQADELQSDLNGIPLSAIERIEVLPTSASGIYGGSATGGVINVILRRDYSGVETALTYENSFEGGGASRRFDVFGGEGFAEGKASLQFIGSYSDINPIKVGDRGVIQKYLRRWQEDQIARLPESFYNAYNPPLGATANISSYVDRFDPDTGAWLGLEPLTLKAGGALGSTITSLPAGYDASSPGAAAALIANAGRYNMTLAPSNQFGSGALADLTGGTKKNAFDIALRTKLTPEVDAFIELGTTRTDYAYASQITSGGFVISSTAPNNPFEQDILVNAPVLPGVDHEGVSRNRADTRRVLIGANWRITPAWSSAFEYSYSFSKAWQNTDARGTFLDGTAEAIGTGVIDLLQDPAGYADALNAALIPNGSIDPTRSHLNDISLRIAGPVLNLPAGALKLSFLAEEARQYYGPFHASAFLSDGTPYNNYGSGGKSNVSSAYTELTVPLASQGAPLLGIRSAELQLAARYDRYKQQASLFSNSPDDGRTPATGSFDSVVPTFGLRVVPLRDVVVRASYGRGFLPPYINQIQPAQPLDAVLDFLTDPKRGNEPLGMVRVYSGGNPDLKPETSESRSAGIIFTPATVQDLRVSFDWTQIEKRNNIAIVGGFNQRWINNEDLYPGMLTRGEPDGPGVGPIVEYDFRLRNVLRSISESYDLSADYAFRVGTARVSAAVTATRLLKNFRQLVASSPQIDFAGTSSYPQWAGNASVVSRWSHFAATLNGQYFDSYFINDDRSFDPNQNSFRLKSQMLFDLAAEYSFHGGAGLAGRLLSGSTVRAGVKNLLDEQPRYLASQFGTRADFWAGFMGRAYFLSLNSTFGQ